MTRNVVSLNLKIRRHDEPLRYQEKCTCRERVYVKSFLFIISRQITLSEDNNIIIHRHQSRCQKTCVTIDTFAIKLILKLESSFLLRSSSCHDIPLISRTTQNQSTYIESNWQLTIAATSSLSTSRDILSRSFFEFLQSMSRRNKYPYDILSCSRLYDPRLHNVLCRLSYLLVYTSMSIKERCRKRFRVRSSNLWNYEPL